MTIRRLYPLAIGLALLLTKGAAESQMHLLPQKQAGEFLTLATPQQQPRTIELKSLPVAEAPQIDGDGRDAVWQRTPAVTTRDFSSQRPVTLKSIHTNTHIFFLANIPDQAPSEMHRSWGWDAREKVYKPIQDREDVFVLKWSLVGNDVSLAFRDAQPHRADVWYWKAKRTNPSGYADDKWQSVSRRPHKKARHLAIPGHETLYLRRVGDAGRSAYGERLLSSYEGDIVSRYESRVPEGSRADIRARGRWHDGYWSIEFARRLDTGHDDDIAFVPNQVYLFAISCYEMAGGKVQPLWSQPLYKTGDAFDRLLLRIVSKDGA